jgi:hypothetical protein
MEGLIDWVAANWEEVKKAQSQFDAKQGEAMSKAN